MTRTLDDVRNEVARRVTALVGESDDPLADAEAYAELNGYVVNEPTERGGLWRATANSPLDEIIGAGDTAEAARWERALALFRALEATP
jgi:hypothetical protein